MVQPMLFSITGFFKTSFVLTLILLALFHFLGLPAAQVWKGGRCIEIFFADFKSLETHRFDFMAVFILKIGLADY